MPPRKRQAEAQDAAPVAKRRSTRQAAQAASKATPSDDLDKKKAVPAKPVTQKQNVAKKQATPAKPPKKEAPSRRASSVYASPRASNEERPAKGAVAEDKSARGKPVKKAAKAAGRDTVADDTKSAARAMSEDPDYDSIPERNPEVEQHEGEWYWLMKAEPETRYENGIDVSFSIDDLASRKQPEPWDGIRSYAARNNMRAMNLGDKVFFYHSNCKEPGIVGIMEVVKEFSEDRSARRPGSAYYDPSATKEKPKWGLVHVKFVEKFAKPILLAEMKGDKALENMQLLKQSRLSVSRVGKEEWEWICGLARKK